jgi:CBS domain-containing protein
MATVAELMSRQLVTSDGSATLGEAASVMAQRRVGSVLVLEGERLAGIFSERDIVRALSHSHDAVRDPVAHWMTQRPVTIGPDASAEEALEKMLKGGFRHLPVVEGERLVGMVSMRDLSAALS